ncbi:hypothetical protein TRV_01801 [Trichophyton verrucosum HKI 0517]|uniref:Uncharacterized protein n=1 Tax=Trichophyton verrucosum (strain HKI 0517) TaxID=663202 RepID=D4D3Y8_TRIVH|nr:uncharacterized protein TRV_01801 [Trichophyton verrucosum HKI 0517]EFE43416.1 hypothetical protein TRV_01801 [Trichophyton verrucosum HKI 0517]
MTPRPLYLVTFRTGPSQRKHFAIFLPNEGDSQQGTVIHVVGAPMAGYQHEFKRNYNPFTSAIFHTVTEIAQIDDCHIANPQTKDFQKDSTPKGDLEIAASQVRPPPISQNFLAPVDGVTNKRCQEWTVEFVDKLIEKNYIHAQAREIVQAHRDPPSHGVGLQPAGRGRGAA